MWYYTVTGMFPIACMHVFCGCEKRDVDFNCEFESYEVSVNCCHSLIYAKKAALRLERQLKQIMTVSAGYKHTEGNIHLT